MNGAARLVMLRGEARRRCYDVVIFQSYSRYGLLFNRRLSYLSNSMIFAKSSKGCIGVLPNGPCKISKHHCYEADMSVLLVVLPKYHVLTCPENYMCNDVSWIVT